MIPAPWLSGCRYRRLLLLNNYPATVAYSLQRLKGNATKSIRVRRSSDNDETDIGFTGYLLDQNALTSFCGAGDGYVTKLYEQMTNGSGANFVQSTAGSQPRIVSSGSVLTRYGHPMIQCSDTSRYLENEDNDLFKNKDYIRIYFTVSKPDVNRYDDIVIFGARSPLGFGRVLMEFGAQIGTARNIFASAQTGVAYNGGEEWYLYNDDLGGTQFGNSISTLNVMMNWNSTSSGVSDICRRGKVTRHADDLVTDTSVGGTETANSYNETASKITMCGWWNGSNITLVSTLMGYNEFILYSGSTYHGNDADINANIAARY